MTKTALFHRQYLGYSGGHGKVWDYFNHLKRSGLYALRIFFTSDSVFDATNPWLHSVEHIASEWHPEEADLLFLAGMDWQAMPAGLTKNIPVINLIQGVRHADPQLPLYGFLKRPAIRICVSHPIADAIRGTGQVQGPIHVIPNGIQLPAELNQPIMRSDRIFISAIKNIPAGLQIADQARRLGYTVDLLIKSIPKAEYLKRIKESRIAVLLPLSVEGFYLPGLEAMMMGTPVIMPDCIGNREYARHEKNCLISPLGDIISAIRYFDSPQHLNRIHKAGLETAGQYTIQREYERFIEVMRIMGLTT
jgi:glycosyltransferase involved in cell wall biosynthesis